MYYVAWYKDGVLISSEDLASGTILMSSSDVNVTSSYENSRSLLTIESASITDTGNYTCAVSCGAEDVAFNMIADNLKLARLVTVYGEIVDDLYIILASDPAFGRVTCYCELCAIKSGPANFEASSLVATEGSCYI